MNDLEKTLHQQALAAAKNYRLAEADLLDILQKIDEKKVFGILGYPSLFQYAVTELKLAEGAAFNFINVMRKAREIPEIKTEIRAGTLTVSKIRKVTAVMKKENASAWLERAKVLPSRMLEKEVAKIVPQALTPERATYVTEKRLSWSFGVEERVYEKLQRVKDVLSQKIRRNATTEEALEAMVDLYLWKFDPVQKAMRAGERTRSLEAIQEDSLPQTIN